MGIRNRCGAARLALSNDDGETNTYTTIAQERTSSLWFLTRLVALKIKKEEVLGTYRL